MRQDREFVGWKLSFVAIGDDVIVNWDSSVLSLIHLFMSRPEGNWDGVESEVSKENKSKKSMEKW